MPNNDKKSMIMAIGRPSAQFEFEAGWRHTGQSSADNRALDKAFMQELQRVDNVSLYPVQQDRWFYWSGSLAANEQASQRAAYEVSIKAGSCFYELINKSGPVGMTAIKSQGKDLNRLSWKKKHYGVLPSKDDHQSHFEDVVKTANLTHMFNQCAQLDDDFYVSNLSIVIPHYYSLLQTIKYKDRSYQIIYDVEHDYVDVLDLNDPHQTLFQFWEPEYEIDRIIACDGGALSQDEVDDVALYAISQLSNKIDALANTFDITRSVTSKQEYITQSLHRFGHADQKGAISDYFIMNGQHVKALRDEIKTKAQHYLGVDPSKLDFG